MRITSSFRAVLAYGAAAGLLMCAMTSTAANDRTPSVPPELYVDPNGAATQAATTLDGQTKRDALMLAKMPAATWFTKGSPGDVEASVRDLVDRAATAGRMPVLVAYNIPLRDCQLYSAGGAANTDTYISWIKGFAAGIGDRAAIVVLEPDSLGVIPWHRTLSGTVENCQPKDVDRAAISAARFTQLSKAVDILSALPNARIYLDATNSNWLPPGEAISRLLRANIARADGFFLNVSNFESDDRVSRYARWVSDCLALVTIKRFLAKDCPSQYSPAAFDDVATWRTTDDAYDRLFRELGLKREPGRQKHAIIDTSRSGTGSWKPSRGKYADAEIWCNPPGRGLGRVPTLRTGVAYVDAFLWIKIPGESDGQCLRGTKGQIDPERGVAAPVAGQWFPDQARELIKYANPPLVGD